jgi:hypothetical protein
MEMSGEDVREKIDSLMRYRDALDESEKELFDVLMSYADEVARAVGRGVAPQTHAC